MIPYYAYKRYKQNQALKEAALDKHDEYFLEKVVESTPEPPQSSVTVDAIFDESKSDWNKEKEKKDEPWTSTLKRWGTLGRTASSSSVTSKKVSSRWSRMDER